MKEVFAAAISMSIVNFWVAFWLKGPGVYYWYKTRTWKK